MAADSVRRSLLTVRTILQVASLARDLSGISLALFEQKAFQWLEHDPILRKLISSLLIWLDLLQGISIFSSLL